MDKNIKVESKILQIQMFGGFCLRNGGQELTAEGIRSKMVTKLLAYMLCHRGKAIGIQELSEVLWSGDESDNPAGALKNLMYRLRGILKNSLGAADYIVTGRGAYQWNPSVSAESDIELFEVYCKRAETSSDIGERMESGMKAMDLYQGGFMPELTEEHWVIALSTYYHSTYLSLVKMLAGLLEKDKQYKVMEQVCQKAVRLEPLDEEIHCWLLRAMMGQNKQKLALVHYQDTVKLLYDSLGVRPSKELEEIFEELQREQHRQQCDINVIQKQLQEDCREEGAFLCEYGIFRKVYALESRSSGRLGISVHLVLITLHPTITVAEGSEEYIDRKSVV